MRLATNCSNTFCRGKFYINSNAKTRNELYNSYRGHPSFICPYCQNNAFYSVNNIYAESAELKAHVPKSSAIGAAIGGFVGIIAGPAGILLGASIGAGIGGTTSYVSDQNEVSQFNNSRLY